MPCLRSDARSAALCALSITRGLYGEKFTSPRASDVGLGTSMPPACGPDLRFMRPTLARRDGALVVLEEREGQSLRVERRYRVAHELVPRGLRGRVLEPVGEALHARALAHGHPSHAVDERMRFLLPTTRLTDRVILDEQHPRLPSEGVRSRPHGARLGHRVPADTRL